MKTETEIIRKNPFSNWNDSYEDIYKLIDSLQNLVEGRPSIFGKALMVDSEEFHMIAQKIRASLPSEIRKAKGLQNESDKIVTSAREEAEMIKEQAVAEANRIVEESRKIADSMTEASEIKRMASAQAQAIMQGAESSARDERKCADEYSLEVLGQLENHLVNVLNVLKKDCEKLHRRIGNAEAEELTTAQNRQSRR